MAKDIVEKLISVVKNKKYGYTKKHKFYLYYMQLNMFFHHSDFIRIKEYFLIKKGKNCQTTNEELVRELEKLINTYDIWQVIRGIRRSIFFRKTGFGLYSFDL